MERIPDVSSRHAHRAEGVQWSEDKGRVTVRRRRFGRFGSALVRLARAEPDLTIHLDPIGSAVWLLCDGRKVSEIQADLARRFPGQEDIGRRLGSFLGTMVSKGMLRLD